MIEKNAGVDHSYQAQSHDHKVTECLHEEEKQLKREGNAPIDASELKRTQKFGQTVLSLRNIMTNGWNSISSKAERFWNDDRDRQESAEAVLITSAVKSENQGNERIAPEKDNERKVNDVEGAVSGGLKREQGSMRKFLQQFAETISSAAGRWKRTKKPGNVQPSEPAAAQAEKHSHLLDSYSKTGEYSTLARDGGQQSSFRAKG